jgi:hypothetical protein
VDTIGPPPRRSVTVGLIAQEPVVGHFAYFVKFCTEVCPGSFMGDRGDAPSSAVREPGMTQLMQRAGAGGAAARSEI